MYFYGSNLGPPLARGHLEPGDLHMNKLGKDHLAMLHTKFQASEHGGSEEEDFLIYFYVSMVRTWDPLAMGHLGP